jgi:hypothetical protein
MDRTMEGRKEAKHAVRGARMTSCFILCRRGTQMITMFVVDLGLAAARRAVVFIDNRRR